MGRKDRNPQQELANNINNLNRAVAKAFRRLAEFGNDIQELEKNLTTLAKQVEICEDLLYEHLEKEVVEQEEKTKAKVAKHRAKKAAQEPLTTATSDVPEEWPQRRLHGEYCSNCLYRAKNWGTFYDFQCDCKKSAQYLRGVGQHSWCIHHVKGYSPQRMSRKDIALYDPEVISAWEKHFPSEIVEVKQSIKIMAIDLNAKTVFEEDIGTKPDEVNGEKHAPDN